MVNYIKWISTFLVLTGILLTNLNIYPINIVIHGVGAVGWTIAGYLTSDRALLTNFGLQLPLFMTGYINVLIQLKNEIRPYPFSSFIGSIACKGYQYKYYQWDY